MSIILKALAIVFSLGIIVSYSVYKHKQSRPQSISEPGVFPVVPSDPAMFSTSKSGPIDVIPVQPRVQFSTSKSAAPIVNRNDLSEAARQFDPFGTSVPQTVIPTTKSGVILKPSDIKIPMPVQQSQTNLPR